jgi:hypothetical protein
VADATQRKPAVARDLRCGTHVLVDERRVTFEERGDRRSP